jgi:hypothetical protein
VFAQQGYELEEPEWYTSADAPKREGQAVLAPRGDPSFIVVVTTDSEAEEAWPDFERMQDENSFDAWRANVGVFADDRPPRRERLRILAALSELPDRGEPIDVAGA